MGAAFSAGLVAAVLIAGQPAQPAQPTEPVSDANPLIIAGTSVAIIGAIAAWGYGAWWNTDLQSFHFLDTGFLGRDTYAGGSDKLGHTYAAYVSTLFMTRLYEALGMKHTSAALLAAGAVTFASNGIEITDGFTRYGFEYEDVLFNLLGIAAGLTSELVPEFKSIFGMRLAYIPSHDFLANDKTFIKWINDYSGMIYYFDLKMKGVFEAFGGDPGLARYLLAGVVWSTDQYSPVRVDENRRRSLGVYAGISLPQILRDAYPGDEGVEAYATFFDYYAIPFLSISAMTDLNSGDWYVNFGVANRLEIGL